MIFIKKRWRIIPIREHWFEFNHHWYDYLSFAVYFRVPQKVERPRGMLSFTGRTIQINLQNDLESIWNAFSKQTKNYIRQAERNGLTVDFNCGIEEFVTFFNKFARRKGISAMSRSDFDNINQNYTLTKIRIGSEVVAMHFYLLDPETGMVQLFRSASGRYFIDHIKKNEIGAANKFMHYKAIEHFKSQGFHIYDFGGYSLPSDQDYKKFTGVNQFKKNFGGEEVVYRDFASPAYYLAKRLTDFYSYIRS
jgi:hypothetical protein